MLPASVAGMLPRRQRQRQRQAIARASVSALVASLPLLYVSLLRPPPAALAGDTAFWFLMSNCVIAAIVATSDDAGTLLFRSAADDDDDPCCDDDGGGGGGLSCASAGQPPVAVQRISSDAVVPSAASSQDAPRAVDMNVGRVQEEEVASAVTSSYSVGHALSSLIEGEQEDAASEPSAEINRPIEKIGEEEEEWVTIETSAVKNNTVKVKAQAEDETSTKSLPEEGAADGEWPIALYSRPPEAPARDKDVTSEGELGQSATVGSKPAAEESEYWQLSDEELNRRVEDFIARFNREMRLQIEQEAGV